MLIGRPELERLADEVAELAGETRPEALRRALAERRDRLSAEARPLPIPAHDVAARLAAWRQLRESIALTPEQADAWGAEIRAERMAHRIPGDVDPDDGQ